MLINLIHKIWHVDLSISPKQTGLYPVSTPLCFAFSHRLLISAPLYFSTLNPIIVTGRVTGRLMACIMQNAFLLACNLGRGAWKPAVHVVDRLARSGYGATQQQHGI